MLFLPFIFCEEFKWRTGRNSKSNVRRGFFFFNDAATTEIYTLSLHDALPISKTHARPRAICNAAILRRPMASSRSEDHTSELQSLAYLVCRLLLEKTKARRHSSPHHTVNRNKPRVHPSSAWR